MALGLRYCFLSTPPLLFLSLGPVGMLTVRASGEELWVGSAQVSNRSLGVHSTYLLAADPSDRHPGMI